MAKSIILFSDGTGNSSAKLFKTNVWRMYEAVDLGPSADGKRDQISYYDDGVGTSSFKPLTLLGGAFGVGLQRNVLDIYRFACRNYRNGDDIYAFGFSRGAFTIRLVVALIASEGLVQSSSEAELEWKSREAYRNFRAAFVPRQLKWPTRLVRRVRNWIDGRRARLRHYDAYDPADNCWPKIRFVGVWDTVSAYGGPITEVTRAIDNWIYPLSMPNYQLNEHVQCARHALSLDDERDAFQPLVWDELHEQRLVGEKRVKEGRLQQVWFTGMHADVGGGYPDESLSYVSLLWMMEEAEKAGLRTLKVIRDRFMALASSYGPIHDSRAGLAAYYRYQPRKIAAWLDPVDPATLSLRDPALAVEGRLRGLMRSVNVHESVIRRIASGTDRYTPITLPEIFAIVPPQVKGETAPQADNQTPGTPAASATPRPMISAELRERLTSAAASAARAAATEAIWDYVWWRRLTYFATLGATLLLLALPMIAARLPTPPLLSDGRTWIGGIIRLAGAVLPDFASDWIEAYANNPFYFLLLGLIVVVLYTVGTRLERTLRDEARRAWKKAVDGEILPGPRISSLQAFRNNPGYQRFVQLFKWGFLPRVIGVLFVVVEVWVGLALFAQTMQPVRENGGLLCHPTPGGGSDITIPVARDFSTAEVCSPSFGRVLESQRYVVTFDRVDPWYDGTHPTSPVGLAAGDLSWGLGYVGAPLRRVIGASFLQPIAEIRRIDGRRAWGNTQIYPITVLPVGDSVTLYRGEFTAPRSGELFLFANDSMIPLMSGVWGKYDYTYFYKSAGFGSPSERGNRGTACVTIERVSGVEQKPPNGTPTAGSICATAADRNARETAAKEAAAKAKAASAPR